MVYINKPLGLLSFVLSLTLLTEAASSERTSMAWRSHNNILAARNGSDVFNINGQDHKNHLTIHQTPKDSGSIQINIALKQANHLDISTSGHIKRKTDGLGITVCTNGATTPRSTKSLAYWGGQDGAVLWCIDVTGLSSSSVDNVLYWISSIISSARRRLSLNIRAVCRVIVPSPQRQRLTWLTINIRWRELHIESAWELMRMVGGTEDSGSGLNLIRARCRAHPGRCRTLGSPSHVP